MTRSSPPILVTCLLGLVLAQSAAALGPTCTGDCSGDQTVTVNELVLLTNLALSDAAVEPCPAGDEDGDGRITIPEIIRGVRHLLEGCPAVPTTTPTPAESPAPAPSNTPTPSNTPPPSSTPAPLLTPDPLRPDLLPAHPLAAAGRLDGPFATSSSCGRCHANGALSTAMRDAAGRPIAPFDLWRSSQMANSARDPIFRAQLALETQRFPNASNAIEATCLACHAPALSRERQERGAPPPRLADLSEAGTDAQRGLDGVTCTTCHRIAPDGLGTEASFEAQYELGPADVIYGPYVDPDLEPMRSQSGFRPNHGPQILDSALCGSCHTLVTHALRPDGSPSGVRFEEQTPFLEYRASTYPAEGHTCQSCHAPQTDVDGRPITTKISTSGNFGRLRDRSPYGRHVFVGGNTLVPQMLRNEPLLGATAPPAAFDATREAARQMLESAARIVIGDLEEGSEGTFLYPVTILSETGHKLPTGYGARRIILHVRVFDEADRLVLESGRLDAEGRVTGLDGTPLPAETDPALFEPHRTVVDGPDIFVAWERVTVDEQERPTTSLLAAVRSAKDNRILPRGHDASTPDGARTAPVGVEDDPDFRSGQDSVHVILRGIRPARIEVALLYQVLSPKWREALAATATPWSIALEEMLGRADTSPVVMAEASRQELPLAP